MTKDELILGVKEVIRTHRTKFSPQLLDGLVEFYDDFDPYGMRDAFGDLTVQSHREKAKKDIRYVLRTDPEHILNDLQET